MNLDAFREMVAAMQVRTGFDGTTLKFTKGDWVADAANMNGCKLVALILQLMFGWVRWVDKKPVDYHVGLVADRYRPPKKSELDGDLDNWVMTWFVPLIDPQTGELYVFSTSSKGGRDAWAKLQKDYIAHHEENQDNKLPCVVLGSDSYHHPVYGLVATPTLEVTDWVEPPNNLKKIRPPTPVSPLLIAPPKEISEDLNDDVPF
jgi:hypothetical protein